MATFFNRLISYMVTINLLGVFLFVSILVMLFVVWKEGKSDGFDTERLFDLFLISIFTSIAFSRIFYAFNHALSAKEFYTHIYQIWVFGYSLLGGLLGFLIPVFVLSRIWSWSFYRLVDTFSLGASLGLALLSLGYVGLQAKFEFLFGFSLWIFIFLLLSKLRNFNIKSGHVFVLFLPLSAIFKLLFFKNSGGLNFLLVSVTLSLAVFIFRYRSTNYDKTRTAKFIERVRREVIGQKERVKERLEAFRR